MRTCAGTASRRGFARRELAQAMGTNDGMSFRMADAKPGQDRNSSSGFSDRPNQCKQLDIAGNISFLRAVRRSTAKRAQTTGYGVEGGWDVRKLRRRGRS